MAYTYRRSPASPLPGGRGRYWQIVGQWLAGRGRTAQVYDGDVSRLYDVMSSYTLDVQGSLSDTALVANISQAIAWIWSQSDPGEKCLGFTMSVISLVFPVVDTKLDISKKKKGCVVRTVFIVTVSSQV